MRRCLRIDPLCAITLGATIIDKHAAFVDQNAVIGVLRRERGENERIRKENMKH